MRSSLAKLSFLILFSTGCAQRANVIEVESSDPQDLKALKEKEFRFPSDPVVKEELAQRYWCQGDKGIAMEHWKWIRQFASETPSAERSQDFLLLIQEGNDSRVSRKLNCP